MQINNEKTKRLGIHYYPDTFHYRERDIHRWLPEIEDLGISWITLLAPHTRAIPEFFIRSLIDANIAPILLMQTPIQRNFDSAQLKLLLSTYARWGVRYISIFDRPNLRGMWKGCEWTINDIVERFLDIYLSIASNMINLNLIPLLPPLEPGGDYWDTAFLRMVLRGIKRRDSKDILDNLVIGAYGWKYDRPLDWGIGGPEQWPESRPYFTPTNSQDQIGFRIFDWYSTIIRAELNQDCPILVVAGGEKIKKKSQLSRLDFFDPSQTLIAITEMLIGATNKNSNSDFSPIPDHLTAFNFWLLTAPDDSPDLPSAWIKQDGSTLPVVHYFRRLRRQNNKELDGGKIIPNSVTDFERSIHSHPGEDQKPIDHYLLLPIYSWGAADWDLDTIRPFVQRFQPTVGFSMNEAKHSKRVTIAGRISTLPVEQLDQLRSAGCMLDRLSDDGTILAIK